MASFKQIDNNPEFTFEYTKDVEETVMAIIHHELLLPDSLDGSKEFIGLDKVRYTFIIKDPIKANGLSEALKMFRVNFYGLNNLDQN